MQVYVSKVLKTNTSQNGMSDIDTLKSELVTRGDRLIYPAMFVTPMKQGFHVSVISAPWTVRIPALDLLEGLKGWRRECVYYTPQNPILVSYVRPTPLNTDL